MPSEGARTPYSAENAIQAYTRAEQLMQADKFAEAEVIYRRLLAVDPTDPALLAKLAMALLGGGAMAEAEVELRKAVDLQPQEATLHNALGNILRTRGALKEAETSFRRAIARSANYADAYCNLGNVLETTGRDDEAMVAYRRAIAIQPNHARTLVRIAVFHIGRREFNEALALLDRAAAANGENFDALYHRGSALSGLKRYSEAIAVRERAAALRPDRLEAFVALGNVQRDAGFSDAALDNYWKVLEIRPDLENLHYELNALAWETGRKDLHMRSFERARELGVQTPELIFLEAKLRLRLEEDPEAERLLRIARAMAPERTDFTSVLAGALARQGKYDESFELFSAAIKANPTSPTYRQEFGYALLSAKQSKEAARLFDEARQLDPYDQLALAGLSLAYREGGDGRYEDLVDFQKFVRVYEIPPAAEFGSVDDFNAELASQLTRLHTARFAPIDQTLRGGTQTAGALFDQDARAIAALRKFCDEAIADYARAAPSDANHPLYTAGVQTFAYKGSWSCALRPGGYHNNHVHHMGRISSVYYVKVPEAVEDDGRQQGWLKFGESNYKLSKDDRAERLVKPAPGLLVLFPSYYWHGTVPFDGEQERLTVAFDARTDAHLHSGH